MKQLFLTLFVTGLFLHGAFAQNISSYFKDISKSDITKLSEKFSTDMEVCVNNSQEFMSKSEAIKAVNKFLQSVEPFSGAELHQGSSKTKSSQYRVGQLKTAKGNYRVFIYLEGDAKDFEIVGLLFNPE